MTPLTDPELPELFNGVDASGQDRGQNPVDLDPQAPPGVEIGHALQDIAEWAHLCIDQSAHAFGPLLAALEHRWGPVLEAVQRDGLQGLAFAVQHLSELLAHSASPAASSLRNRPAAPDINERKDIPS